MARCGAVKRRFSPIGRVAATVLASVALVAGLAACEAADRSPIGHLDDSGIDFRHPGANTIAMGWAYDEDSPEPVNVHVYIDGRLVVAAVADQPRPDVAAAYPGAGPAHGFEVNLGRIENGRHTLCVYAINIGTGANNALIGCGDASYEGSAPWGWVDRLRVSPQFIGLLGWASDYDTPDPIQVHVYIDGVFAGAVLAQEHIGDLGGVVAFYEQDHHFSFLLTPTPTTGRQVCVYAIDAGPPGRNALLGCQMT
jgi:hypothetical protein